MECTIFDVQLILSPGRFSSWESNAEILVDDSGKIQDKTQDKDLR